MKFYPQAAPTTPVMLAQIVKRIEKRSTVSSADVKAVLDALQYKVIEALENGNTVRLGDIGSFCLTIKAEGAATAVEAKTKGAKLIKQVNVQFTKSTAIRDSFDIRSLDFAPAGRHCKRKIACWQYRNALTKNVFPAYEKDIFHVSEAPFSRLKNTPL